MPPFTSKLLISGFKEKIESITSYADRLYIGTSLGNLHIYALARDGENGDLVAAFDECKKAFTPRAIEELGYVKDVNSLVVLSGGAVTLFPSPTFSPPTLLTQAKGALSFGIDTSIQYSSDTADAGNNTSQGMPSVVTRLAVGCRRKIVVYTWKDGEAQEVKELNLPHSPRVITFSTPNVLVLSYTSTEHVLLKVPMMSITELVLPAPPPSTTIGGMGKGALSGWGGYMTLGLGAKAKPFVYRTTEDGEFAVKKDNISMFFDPDGQVNRSGGFEWPGPPDETGKLFVPKSFVKPYMLSVLPPGTVPLPSPKPVTSGNNPPQNIPTTYQMPCVQIVSSLSLSTMQTIPFPFSEDLTAKLSAADPAPVNTPPPSVRLLSASPHAQSPAFVTSTPGDRTVAANEGSAVWSFVMVPWGEQIDELVDAGRYADALTLLNILDVTSLPDKDKRQAHIRGLHAVSVFKEGKYVEAIKTFIDLDINPAKVVALYPESVSGRLSVPQTKWIELFGGKPTKPPELEKEGAPDADKADGGAGGSSIAGQLRATLETLVPAIPEVVSGLSGQDDDAKSIKSVGTVGKGKEKLEKAKADDSRRSIENLLVYLGDRRPKLSGALLAFHITPEKAPDLPDLSETSIEDLFLMPNQPIPSLIPEQLLRYAQIVDTALFKSYLVIRPGLVGSLCRLDNWCEVAEVEEVLRERKKFSELIDLYRTKKMHEKALTLLKELSQGEDDPVEKVDPTALYLQKLGPQHIKLIFSWSNWVLDISPERGLKVFMAEEHELPRKDVASFLAGRDSSLCARYIEYLMEEEHVTDTLFHNWLAEIYMDLIVTAKRRGDEAARSKVYEQLLTFLDTSTYYEVDRIFARLPSDDLYEARAILLGRLGKNEAALDIYVNRLQDFAAAESYCKRVYQTVPNPKGIFLTLLRIYLRPSSAGASASLTPALDLISRHSPRLDSAEVLKMLPPFVNATDVRVFLTEALKAPRIDTRITRELYKARAHQVDRKLMALHSKRVKVADSRICPQCHKRLGNSVIAVHAPRGEVTHYQCREAFVKRKTEATGSR